MVSKRDMKVFEELINECKEVVESCGYTLPSIQYSLNARLSRSIGRCMSRTDRWTMKRGNFRIELAESYFLGYIQENNLDKIRNVILHEMCHALPDGGSHGAQWKHYAYVVGKKSNQNISRIAEMDSVIANVKKASFKYSIVCNSCGKVYNYSRKPKFVNNLANCKCSCGSNCLELKTL